MESQVISRAEEGLGHGASAYRHHYKQHDISIKEAGKSSGCIGMVSAVSCREGKGPRANHPETLTSVNNIASLFHSEGEYEESLKWHQRAMEGREKSFGKEHPLTFQCCSALLHPRKIRGCSLLARENTSREGEVL